MTVERRRKHWGWGYEDEQPGADELRAAAAGLADHLGFGEREPEAAVALDDVELAPPRLETPYAQDTWSRAAHAQGRSYLDVVRGLRGEFPHPPDGVAFPASEEELRAVLDWCGERDVAVVPFGGGTSVVGGVDAIPGPGHAGVVAINLRGLDRVLEVDPVSRAARSPACTISRIASRPAAKSGNATVAARRRSGRGCTRTQASVMTASVPSEPSSMRSGEGPAPEPGSRRDCHTSPAAVSARTDSTMSSMWVFSVAKCPPARVAIQPPSVESSNDCG